MSWRDALIVFALSVWSAAISLYSYERGRRSERLRLWNEWCEGAAIKLRQNRRKP